MNKEVSFTFDRIPNRYRFLSVVAILGTVLHSRLMQNEHRIQTISTDGALLGAQRIGDRAQMR